MEEPLFWFKLIEETATYCAMRYTGSDAEAVVPDKHWGRPVTALFDDLFKGHGELRSVVIPDTVTQIGGFVFDGCTSLHHVTLPKSLEDLWQYAFVRSSIEEIAIPDGVRAIIPFTFKDCKQLRCVVCGSGLQKVYSNAFAGCDALEEFVCGMQVELCDGAFGKIPEIKRIDL